MKSVKIFYLKNCPYCIKMFKELEELLLHSAYKKIDIRCIEESVEESLANSYDYYYVPSIYVDDKLVLEGKFDKKDLRLALDSCLIEE